ncbi:MAG: polyhydroxyalkanoate depolymerase [Candidatus Puniceispirillum sp.]|nr:polyhydroxyalkanoate depolymerase [Candidatus Pelagibacter sp.]MBA4283183.1 polyhydroxyalkanoate depolymerase [Candidatus Puniceispirillum sp.]
MIYQLFETQKWMDQNFRMTNRYIDDIVNLFGGNNLSTQHLYALREVSKRLEASDHKPHFNIKTIDVNHFGNDKHSYVIDQNVILRSPFCKLVEFEKVGLKDTKNFPNVLLVAPLSGHYATLLRDTVIRFLPDHNVFITDWENIRDISASEGEFNLDSYTELLVQYIEHFKGDIHLVAVCQPVVPVLTAVSYLAQNDSPYQAKSMTLMGGPVDASVNPGEVNKFALRMPMDWFERNMISTVPDSYKGRYRKVCPGFLMLNGFVSMNYKRHFESVINLYQNVLDNNVQGIKSFDKFYDEYRAVMDLSAPYYLQSVEKVFKNFDLPKGRLKYKGEKIKPASIKKTSLLMVEGSRDDISPLGQTYAAKHICSSIPSDNVHHYIQEDAGHYGIFSGTKFREQIYPVIQSFILSSEK